jgi:hypothetical protein
MLLIVNLDVANLLKRHKTFLSLLILQVSHPDDTPALLLAFGSTNTWCAVEHGNGMSGE